MENKKLRVLALVGVLLLAIFVYPSLSGQTDEIIPDLNTQIIRDISTEETNRLIQENRGNQDFVLLDIRTPEEYNGGYIEGAINRDFYSPTFREELDKLDKDKTYLIYCRSGRRSGIALGTMKELGFIEAYNMLGGINQWTEEGFTLLS